MTYGTRLQSDGLLASNHLICPAESNQSSKDAQETHQGSECTPAFAKLATGCWGVNRARPQPSGEERTEL